MVKIVKISDITQFANTLARSIRANLKWSKKLRGQVKMGRGVTNGDTTSIAVTIAEGNIDLAGMARAFAFGSGIHASRGRRGKYLISPKNKKALWFPYPSPKVLPGTVTFIKDGQFGITTKYVMHPGVESKDYIRKSVEATLAKAVPELKLAIRKNLIDELRISIKGTKR